MTSVVEVSKKEEEPFGSHWDSCVGTLYGVTLGDWLLPAISGERKPGLGGCGGSGEGASQPVFLVAPVLLIEKGPQSDLFGSQAGEKAKHDDRSEIPG